MAPAFKTISVNIAMSMLSIPDLLKRDKPDLLFLQEISSPSETVNDCVNNLGYTAECNIDPLHPTFKIENSQFRNVIPNISPFLCSIMV